jgi:hypothetical protein
LIILSYFGYFILGAFLVGMVILAVPVSLGYHSTERWFRVKWLGLTITRRLGRKKPEASHKKRASKLRKHKGRPIWGRLWQQRELVVELSRLLGRFVLDAGRTLSFRDSEAAVSLPDPMWNGVLYGVLTNIELENVDLSVNFENHNFARIWVTVYPHRVARKLTVLLIHLPYLNLLRFAWDLRTR